MLEPAGADDVVVGVVDVVTGLVVVVVVTGAVVVVFDVVLVCGADDEDEDATPGMHWK